MKPRPARYPDDFAFILDEWVTSFRRSPRAGPIPDEIYRDTYDKVVKIALLRPGVRTAVMEDDAGEVLMGFASAIPPYTILYAYTKRQYREQGICRRLLEELGINLRARVRVAFWTDDARRKLMNGRGRWLLAYDDRVVRYPQKEKVDG